jgi:hypothetical protein
VQPVVRKAAMVSNATARLIYMFMFFLVFERRASTKEFRRFGDVWI